MLGQVRFEKKSQFWFGKKQVWLGQVWNKKLSLVKLCFEKKVMLGLKKKLGWVSLGKKSQVMLGYI